MRSCTGVVLRLGATTALTLLGACAIVSDAPAGGVGAREQIQRLIGQAECQRDDECRSVGVGLQACGGPQAYLAWSTRSTNAQALMAAVSRYADERRLQITKTGEMSTCAVIPDPGARCDRVAPATSGRCVLAKGTGDALR